MTATRFPEINGLLSAPATGTMRYQLKGGEWVTVYAKEAVLYRIARESGKPVGGVVEALAHDGTPGGIEAAVRLLLRFAA